MRDDEDEYGKVVFGTVAIGVGVIALCALYLFS